MRQKNPGISADEALRQSLLAAKQQGAFKPGVTVPWYKAGTSTPASFKPPMALPASGKTEDLVTGQEYKKGNRSMVWNGKGWEAPSKAAAPAGGASEESSPDDDGDEENE